MKGFEAVRLIFYENAVRLLLDFVMLSPSMATTLRLHFTIVEVERPSPSFLLSGSTWDPEVWDELKDSTASSAADITMRKGSIVWYVRGQGCMKIDARGLFTSRFSFLH